MQSCLVPIVVLCKISDILVEKLWDTQIRKEMCPKSKKENSQ